jgi:hypothetical protein
LWAVSIRLSTQRKWHRLPSAIDRSCAIIDNRSNRIVEPVPYLASHPILDSSESTDRHNAPDQSIARAREPTDLVCFIIIISQALLEQS